MKQYARAYLAQPLERIAAIHVGVEQAELGELAADLKIPVQALCKDLRVPSGSSRFSSDASERILRLMALIGQIDTIVQRNNLDARFDPAAWLGKWLSNPVGAFKSIRLVSSLDTMAGIAILSNLLAISESGTFA
ncbi:hypothetical protein JOD97_003843 [Duganella sp. 1411]|uniref:hypothetical protein n=1 Tax=Duganella sp. 1411 TaxID=2806572 RepID=UPI001AE54A68|nr:hypothetical protein [Duganella sp. 1411]MBP1205781.1 hypothetical protein [Duganella sp. 1411]